MPRTYLVLLGVAYQILAVLLYFEDQLAWLRHDFRDQAAIEASVRGSSCSMLQFYPLLKRPNTFLPSF